MTPAIDSSVLVDIENIDQLQGSDERKPTLENPVNKKVRVEKGMSFAKRRRHRRIAILKRCLTPASFTLQRMIFLRPSSRNPITFQSLPTRMLSASIPSPFPGLIQTRASEVLSSAPFVTRRNEMPLALTREATVFTQVWRWLQVSLRWMQYES